MPIQCYYISAFWQKKKNKIKIFYVCYALQFTPFLGKKAKINMSVPTCVINRKESIDFTAK